MARVVGKLTAREVAKATKPGVYGDGGGLALRVGRSGTKAWVFRYQKANRAHELGLGSVQLVSLAEARAKAIQQRRLILDGIDPAQRRKAAAQRAAVPTFQKVAEAYIEAHAPGWRNAKHSAQWTSTLATYVHPAFGTKSVADVALDDVLAVLKPIWTTKPETASRVRGRMEVVLNYATAQGWRAGPNPARWKGHLDNLLPAKTKVRRVVHHPAVPWREIAGVMAGLAPRGGMAALCLRFLILVVARSGEARGARWSEVDMLQKVWTVPGARMKAARDHRVPLSDAALAVLAEVEPLRRGADDLVFPGQSAGRPLSDAALSKLMPPSTTVHGCRSSFRDWASETGQRRELAETALAHVVKDETEAAYARSDLLEPRRALMEAWARHCTKPAGGAGTVVQLRA